MTLEIFPCFDVLQSATGGMTAAERFDAALAPFSWLSRPSFVFSLVRRRGSLGKSW